MGSVKFSPGNARWEVSQAYPCRRFAPASSANVIKNVMQQSSSGYGQMSEPPKDAKFEARDQTLDIATNRD